MAASKPFHALIPTSKKYLYRRLVGLTWLTYAEERTLEMQYDLHCSCSSLLWGTLETASLVPIKGKEAFLISGKDLYANSVS